MILSPLVQSIQRNRFGKTAAPKAASAERDDNLQPVRMNITLKKAVVNGRDDLLMFINGHPFVFNPQEGKPEKNSILVGHINRAFLFAHDILRHMLTPFVSNAQTLQGEYQTGHLVGEAMAMVPQGEMEWIGHLCQQAEDKARAADSRYDCRGSNDTFFTGEAFDCLRLVAHDLTYAPVGTAVELQFEIPPPDRYFSFPLEKNLASRSAKRILSHTPLEKSLSLKTTELESVYRQYQKLAKGFRVSKTVKQEGDNRVCTFTRRLPFNLEVTYRFILDVETGQPISGEKQYAQTGRRTLSDILMRRPSPPPSHKISREEAQYLEKGALQHVDVSEYGQVTTHYETVLQNGAVIHIEFTNSFHVPALAYLTAQTQTGEYSEPTGQPLLPIRLLRAELVGDIPPLPERIPVNEYNPLWIFSEIRKNLQHFAKAFAVYQDNMISILKDGKLGIGLKQVDNIRDALRKETGIDHPIVLDGGPQDIRRAYLEFALANRDNPWVDTNVFPRNRYERLPDSTDACYLAPPLKVFD